MTEPTFVVDIRDGDSITVWIARPVRVTEARVPADGSIMIRDAETGQICGKRVEHASGWTDDALGDSFAVAFGWGGAGPLHAIRNAVMTEHEREWYARRDAARPMFPAEFAAGRRFIADRLHRAS